MLESESARKKIFLFYFEKQGKSLPILSLSYIKLSANKRLVVSFNKKTWKFLFSLDKHEFYSC